MFEQTDEYFWASEVSGALASGPGKLRFGWQYEEILLAFSEVEAGNSAKSVGFFAFHEQKNILQPSIYEDSQLVLLLRGNHASYVTGFPSGVAQAIELTLTSQCQRVDDDRTIGFDDSPIANLADVEQRMAFVIEAANRFDKMLHNSNRNALVQSINKIAVVVAP